jgi:hypothetical protein
MLWVTWRQHRGILISVAVATVAAVVVMLVLGQKVHQDAATLQACQPTPSPACPGPGNFFTGKFWQLTQIVHVAVPALPVLLAMFAGPPVLARELENSTFRYAWTQGIGRVRWAVLKFTILGSVVTIAALLISQLFAWFFDPFLGFEGMNVLASTVFVTRGIAFAAWTLIAYAIGVFLGMLIRRIIPAMAATLGAYLGLNLLAWLVLREDYPVAIDTTNASLFNGPNSPNSPWILKTWTAGGTNWWRYIPVSRFWPTQFIEAGWLLVLAIALGAATVWLVRHRAA